MADGRTPLSGSQYSAADLEAEKGKELVLARQTAPRWKAPHFVWAVQAELAKKLCGPDAPTCDALQQGGLRVTTTLDWRSAADRREVGQGGGHRAPHASNPQTFAKRPRVRRVPRLDPEPARTRTSATAPWSPIDYQTGEIIAQVGSADYYASVEGQALPAAVRRRDAGLPPAGIGVQAVQLRHRHRRRRVDGRRHVHGRRDRLRWRLHPERRRQPRARARCASATRSSSR